MEHFSHLTLDGVISSGKGKQKLEPYLEFCSTSVAAFFSTYDAFKRTEEIEMAKEKVS